MACQRPRPDAARDPPALAPRCRGLRRIRQGDDRHGALRQADARRPRARSAVAFAVRSARAVSARPALPIDVAGIPLPARAAHDDERGRFPRSVVRNRRAEGDDVGIGHHRHVSRCAIARHRVRAAPPLHGRDRRRVPILGIRQRRHRRDLECDRGGGARTRSRDSHQLAREQNSHPQRPRNRRRARERRRDQRVDRVLVCSTLA